VVLIKTSFPVSQKKKRQNKTYFCFAYPNDLEQAYAFYCARYENITLKEFLNLGASEFMIKFNSIPESEPLHTIIKSRTINTSEIKDKEERKYWNKLKRLNAIPSEYLSTKEIMLDLSKTSKEIKI
jgi:hypothetical protein